MHTRTRRHLAAIAATVAVAMGALVSPSPAFASPTTIDTGLTSARGLAVDPGTGRVFVAGDDAVAVLAPDGTFLTKIDEVYGAWGMDATQGSIWVTESTAGRIARIDPVAMEVAESYVVGEPVRDTITVVGDHAFLGTTGQRGSLARFDLTTSTYETFGSFYGGAVRRLGSSTDEVIVFERGISSGGIHRVMAEPPFTRIASGGAGGYFGDLAVSDSGDRLWSATGSPYHFQEFDSTTLANTGAIYQAEPYPTSVAATGAHGGLILGHTRSAVWLYAAGATAPIARFAVANSYPVGGLEFSADGDTGYALTGEGDVEVFDLRPAVTAIDPASVVQDVPTKVSITGEALGGTTSVTVGGVSVPPESVSPTAVTFALPTGVPLGEQPVVLHGPVGDATSTIDVEANVGAVLSGTVAVDGTPLADAPLELSGGALGAPVTVTSGPDGSYGFAPVGYGTDYALRATDPGGVAPDQVITGISLTPNLPTTLDVDLARPSPDGSVISRTTLGADGVNDLLVDDATDTVAVAVGNEVDLLDLDGALLARIRGIGGARSLTLLDGDLYVGTSAQGQVLRVDLTSRQITGTWPLNTLTNGSIAAAGGKIWFVQGNNQWTSIRSLDPATGQIGPALGSFYVPVLESVNGAPNRFLATEPGISSHPTTLLDGSSDSAVEIASVDQHGEDRTPVAPVTAEASTGTIYDAAGYQFGLDDLRADGVRYPTPGPSAYAPGNGGVVAFGTSVAQAGIPTATHAFDGTAQRSGLDPAGTRLYTASGSELVVHDLAPHVTATRPERVRSGPVTIEGTGLGRTDQVRVDGTSVPFVQGSASELAISADGLSPGIHLVAVDTHWGTSSAAPFVVDPPGAPPAPAAPYATLVGNELRVEWSEPADDGGSPITGFTATAVPGGGFCTTTGELACTIASIPSGQQVRVTLTATNALGTSPSSLPSNPVAIPTPPDAPIDLRAYPGPGRASLDWTAPPSDGASRITSYRMCASTDPDVAVDVTCRTSWSDRTDASFTGLTPGTTYHFTVAATNAVGTSAPSAPSIGITPFATASAPSDVVAIAGRLRAEVSWSPPSSDGGAPIDGYRVCAYDPLRTEETLTCSTETSGTSTTIERLEGGTRYEVIVAAQNAAGTGAWSAPATVDIALTTPEPPQAVLAVAGEESVSVSWPEAEADGGSAVTGYRACISTDPAVTEPGATCVDLPGTARTHTFASLTPGVAHRATVTPENALGTGATSTPSNPATPYTRPGPPTDVAVVAGDGGVAVSWRAPTDTGWSPITGYEVTPVVDGVPQTAQQVTGPSTSTVVGGLDNGTTYRFVVAARNAAGPGPGSLASVAVTPAPPGAAPFTTWDAWVAQQRLDLTGTPGTAAGRAADVAALAAGSTAPADYVDELIADPWYEPNVAPAARLYWAYFGRIPDHGGLQFWVRRRRTGTTLIRISASFAGSSEFRTTYGSLDHGEFVDLVYRNVLGRDPDPGGRAFWVGRLQRGTSRGQVMINFSESGEYVRQMEGPIGVVLVVEAMLGRAPTAAEVDTWADEPRPDLIAHVLASDEYAARVS